MLERLTLRMDELVHSFVRNLSSNVDMFYHKRKETAGMVSQVVKQQQSKMDILRIKDVAKYVLLQHYLENSDTRNMQLFIERQTNFFDKFINFTTVPLIASHLKSINKKIVQKGKKSSLQNVVNIKKRCSRAEKNSNHFGHGKPNCQSNVTHVNPTKNIPYSMKKQSICLGSGDGNRSSAMFTERLKMEYRNMKLLESTKTDNVNINLSANIAEYARKQVELNERYIELCTWDKDFMKRSISITLYIGVQGLHKNVFEMTKLSYDQVNILCKQAILCLIEPSDRGFVVFEDNLSTIIQNYLLEGYTYHFNISSDSMDHYSALLVLSHSAKVLVRHPNTVMMRTICSTLHCDSSRIVVLSQSDGNLMDT